MAKNRWELEKKRKQEALAAMQAALKRGAAYKGNAVQQTVSSPVNPKTAQSTLNTARSQSSAKSSSSGSGRSRNSTNTIRPGTTARTLPDKLNSLSSLSGSTERRSGGFSGGGGAGTRLPRLGDTTRAQRSADYDQMTQNSVRWHFADDKEREALRSENDKIRAAYGLTYDPGSGRTYGPGNIDLSRDVGERVQDYLGQGVLSTIGHNTGAGIAGINQAAYSTLDFLLPDVITPDFMQDYIDRAKQDNADIKQSVQDYNYARGGKLGGKVGDLYQSAIEMAPQAVIALMTGNLSTGAQLADTGKNAVSKVVQQVTKSPAAWASFFQTVGNDYEEAKANGANDLEAAASAIISSGINAGIEMTGGLETTGARPKNILNWLKGMNEEGREEVVQGIVSGLTQKGVYDADKPWLTTGSGEGVIDPVRMAQEYGAGAFLSGVMTAPGTFAGRRSTGTQTAQTGDYPAGAQNTAQGGIEQSVSPSGFIVPEAKRRRMAAQDAEYAAQIDGVFNGSMPTDRVVSIGDTPDILLSIGATDLPMTMTQSTARKIAFPAGYMGGSHNLGIPALKRLPEQMRDPAAVLRSKTQPDSFVILTEWNDTNGNPVIIALHLDKQGVVDVTNEVASAYGKNNFAALTGENGENVLYTKNNKSIDQILDNRLQLPALLSDDTLVAYSIAQNSGEGKRQEAINEIDLTPATAIRRSTTDGHITMQSGLFNNSIAQNGGEGNPAQPDSQAIGLRLAELDSAMRTAESLLPGPARDARIAEIRAEMERVQAEAAEPSAAPDGNGQMTMREFQQRRQAQAARDFAAEQNGITNIHKPTENALSWAEEKAQAAWEEVRRLESFNLQDTPMYRNALRKAQDANRLVYDIQKHSENEDGHNLNLWKILNLDAPEVNVPVSEAVQYGATPQQAMREAEVRAQGEAAQEAARSEREETVSGLMQAWTDKRAAEKQAEQTLAGLTLTQHDIDMAQNAARTGVNSQKWEEADNPEKAMLYGKTLRAVRETDQPIRQYFAQRATAMQSEAQHAADAIATYAKDKRFGGQYQRETMERNIRDIFGKDHQTEAEAIIREYITPVHKAVAEGNKLKNSMRERVKALKLNKHERALVQMRLEAEDGAAAEYIENNKIKVTPKMDAKISRAVEEFRSIYNELYNRINETLLLNGQEPAAFRKNYAPHFTKDKPDTVLGRIRFALGLGKDSSLNIPTDIAGLTDTFRPGKKWFGNLLQREGEITDYDAVAGFDQYIENAADVITLTESIQKLRALEDQVRYTLSDEGVQAKIDAIRANPELDALQQREQMEKVYDTNRTTVQQLIDDLRNQQRMGMGRFVTELRRYTDNLAGKKSREDRGWEDMANRQVYQLAKSLEGRVAANMISLNPGSWLTNIIPITQATGEVSVPNLVRGMFQTVKANIKDDGYRDASAFLTNRYGSESIDKTIGRRVSDLSGAPMELIDHFTANTIHRARYAQNIDRGMSMDEAIDDADAYTASLMADRSKGALPTAFNATNPIRKVFTMFQTEVNNQLSYLFKDMPRAQRQKGVAAVAWAYTKVFGTAYLFNLAYSQLTGRDSAFDPIGMIADALGVGDDEDDERTVAERLTGLAEDIGGNIPFVGGIVFDGGRVPISSAFPDFINLGKAVLPSGWTGVEWSGDKRAQTALKEIAKPLTYLVPPFGGGAAKRAIEGFATVNAGGSYTYDNEGNRTLQFPMYGQTPLDYARAMLFGKWSSEEAQEYIDNGFKGLSADETAAFDQLRNSMGLDARQAMDTILGLRGYETVRDEDGNILQTVKDQQRLALFDNDNLTPEQKAAIDRALIVSGEDEQPADYTDRNAFLIGQYVSESRQDAAREVISHGLDIDQFVQWDDRLRELENEKGADDKAVRSAAEARVMLLDEVMRDGALSDGEKQTIADYIVISSMGDSQREDWESIAKGKVSASDYVQFVGDVSAYKEEYKNTGADNSANVAEILRGYDSLTDEQHDVLFQTYSSTMKNNPFHVSEYEQRMQGNSFYDDLNEAGRAEVRALANEYEQAINEGKELSDWQGKAYMAEEAGISPETYILYRVALSATNTDGKGSAKQSEAETAVNLIPGLTQQQKAYLYQSTNTSWKNNPFGSATVTKYNAETTEAINPVEGGTLSSSFGPRSSPTAGASSWHKAIDIAASAGTPVKSVMPGTVVAVNKSGYGGGYGVSVRVDHGNGIITEYHHMQEGSADRINVGDTVEAGQQIGMVGSTGISTGPHLDMQAWKDGQIVDPLTIIPGYGEPSGYVYDGSVSSGVISSGAAQAAAAETSSGSSRQSTGLKSLKGFKRLPTF